MAKILVLEDRADFRNILCQYLSACGHAVTPSSDGPHALIKMSSEQFDLILTDVWMNPMNGLEFIKQAKRKQPTIKIVAMSGGTADIPVDIGLTAAGYWGADEVLMKPFDIDALGDKINHLLMSPPAPRN